MPPDQWPASQPVPYVNRAALELVRRRDIDNDAAWLKRINHSDERGDLEHDRAEEALMGRIAIGAGTGAGCLLLGIIIGFLVHR